MLFFSILLILGIIFTVLHGFNDEDWASVCATVAYMLTVIVLFIWIGNYSASLRTYGRLIAFQEVKPEYKTAIIETKEAVVQLKEKGGAISLTTEDLSTLIELGVSIENFKHSTLTAARIAEARDYVRWYKETLHYYQIVTSNWFTKQFIAKLPPELCK
ncbi:hypothetical protein J7L24_00010 [bacterium]|nr:hypothetical protein [bacterium]